MIPASEIFQPRAIAQGRLRAAVFADAASPSGKVCVLLNGQTEFIEKYFEVIDELRARGFAVATMDWRGQGGSLRALPNRLKGHVEDFSEYDSDLKALMAEIVAPLAANSAPPIALAHSMGGHILLRALRREPEAFSACVFSAPMLGISSRGEPPWLVPLASRAMNGLGRSRDFVFGMGKRDPIAMTFEQQLVTSDPRRFARTRDFLRLHPGLRLAGPTWGWLAAAYRSLAELGAPASAQAISTRVLIFGAGRDRICISAAAKKFAERMPCAEYLELADAEHEILMENDSIRARFWRRFDAFVAAQ